MKRKGTRKVCRRGHVFYKNSDCPICPQCWSGYYRSRRLNDLPVALSAPALRALLKARITNLQQVTRWTEADIAALHGLGPTGIRTLQQALRKYILSFKQ